MKTLSNTALFILITLLFSCSNENSTTTNHPESFEVPGNIENFSLGDIEKEVVTSLIRRPHVNIKQNTATQLFTQQLTLSDPPAPKSMNSVKSYKYEDSTVDPIEYEQSSTANKSLQSSIESVNFDSNAANTGFFNIPADPHGAAGINHVVNVVNTSIEIYTKAGAIQLSQSLSNFFSALSPANNTFDPKVLYDQYEDRFVVVTLESVNTGVAMEDNSAVLVAVSATSDPTGSWYFTRIDVDEVIGATNSWLDYPGFSVDEEAVYITGNMFSFASTGSQTLQANRLLIIDKGSTGGFYDNNTAVVSIIDPIPGGFFTSTQQPAHIFGTPANADFGTYLVMYSGLSDGTNEFFQVIQIDTPTGTPTISASFVDFGNTDSLITLTNAPQSGTVDLIEVNDRRTLNAVLRGNSLWTTTTVMPNAGTPDAGETTALWAELDVDVTAAVTTSSLADVGTIGGEDIAAGTYTFFPAIAVNDDGGVAVAYSASAPTIFAGSYMAVRSPADPAGTNRGAITIRSGTDFYKRTFGGSRNRWGDYISASLDPDGECFWVYNKYAITRGTILIGEDGRWGTAHGHFCNSQPSAQTDDVSVNQGQTITELSNMQTSLMFNDTDADSFDMFSLNLTPATNPSHGSVTLFANGTFSYSHDNSTNNSDSFQYTVCDDGSPSKCDVGTVNVNITLDTYSVGGSVSGLIGSVTLQNNNGDDVTITDAGLQSFTFPVQDDGSVYAVTVSSHPATQNCEVTAGGIADDGTGTLAGSNVTDVLITCTNTYTVSGTVTGLATGNSITLRNNGGDDQTITEGGSLVFNFGAQVDGSTYAIMVFTSPITPNQTCNITGGEGNDGSGTLAGANVTDVLVTCITVNYTVSGTVTGLATGNSVTLRNNNGDDQTVTEGGSLAFSFATQADGSAYAITAFTLPTTPNQTCIITGGGDNDGSGNLAGANVTDVLVTCTTLTYTVGGNVLTLLGSVTLVNNGGDDIVITDMGSQDFIFSAQNDGTDYAVSVSLQPATQTCLVTAGGITNDGSGTLSGSDVIDVVVTCTSNLPTAITDAETVNEDSGVNTLDVLLNDTNPGTIQINSVSQPNNGIVIITNSGADLTYEPNADYCNDGISTDDFTYTLNGGSSTLVNVTVNCVNDQPIFDSDENIYIKLEDLGNMVPENIACNFDFGPDDEDSSQAVADFIVTIQSDPQGILTAIDVLNDGSLVANYSGIQGVAIVNISLQDDGNTINGGVNTSISHPVNIHVQDYIFIGGFEPDTCP